MNYILVTMYTTLDRSYGFSNTTFKMNKVTAKSINECMATIKQDNPQFNQLVLINIIKLEN